MKDIPRWTKIGSLILLIIFCLSLLPLTKTEAAEPQTVRIGYFQEPNFQEGGFDGTRRHGLAYDYLQEIAAIANWHYEYFYGTWDECFRKLQNGEIDIMAGIGFIPERRNYIFYSSVPLLNMPYYIFAPKDASEQYSDYSNIDGKTIAVFGPSLLEKDLREWEARYGYTSQIRVYPTEKEARQAFFSHETDLLVDRGWQMPGDADALPVAKIANEGWYIAVSKQRPDLLQKLNQSMTGLEQSSPSFKASLIEAYYSKTALRTTLTAREQSWLYNHPVIKVGYLSDYAPFCYADAKGRVTGLLADILNYTLDKYHIQSQIEYHEYANYQEMMQAVKNGDINMAFPINSVYWDSEEAGSYQSVHVDEIKVNIIYDKSKEVTPKTVFAISRRSPVQERYMRDNYPNNPYVYYNNVDECLKAVCSGKADATMINSYEATLKLHDDTNLHAEPVDERVAYCFAISPQDSPLTTIINRGITGFGRDAVTDSLFKYTENEHHFTARDFILQNKFSVTMTVLTVLLIFAMLFLVARNRSKQEELARKLAHTDIMTGLLNRRAYEEMLKKCSKEILPGLLTVMVVDLNSLKHINDTRGHEAGDEAIIACADCLQHVFRDLHGSSIYRTGGDEFVVIFGLSHKANQQIRWEISAELARHKGKYLDGLSASCGFATSNDYPNKTIYELVRVADGKMYAEKSANHMNRI